MSDDRNEPGLFKSSDFRDRVSHNLRPKLSFSSIARKVRSQFISGILISIPVGATVLILIWIFSMIDSILRPIIMGIWGRTFPGVGFGITILLIYLVGATAGNVAGKKIISFGESLLLKIPIVRQVYIGIKQILGSFSSPGKTNFMQVVLVEFPRKGIRAIGFLTNDSMDEQSQKMLHVFIPTSPNPTSGFLEFFPEDEVIRTQISVDDALKMIVSAGRMMTPKAIEEMAKTRQTKDTSRTGTGFAI